MLEDSTSRSRGAVLAHDPSRARRAVTRTRGQDPATQILIDESSH